MKKQTFLSFVAACAMLTGSLQAQAADRQFKDFSLILNNENGTILTADEMAAQGNEFAFGIAVSDEGTVSRIATDATEFAAQVTGKFWNDHGSTKVKLVGPVDGPADVAVVDVVGGPIGAAEYAGAVFLQQQVEGVLFPVLEYIGFGLGTLINRIELDAHPIAARQDVGQLARRGRRAAGRGGLRGRRRLCGVGCCRSRRRCFRGGGRLRGGRGFRGGGCFRRSRRFRRRGGLGRRSCGFRRRLGAGGAQTQQKREDQENRKLFHSCLLLCIGFGGKQGHCSTSAGEMRHFLPRRRRVFLQLPLSLGGNI